MTNEVAETKIQVDEALLAQTEANANAFADAAGDPADPNYDDYMYVQARLMLALVAEVRRLRKSAHEDHH